MINKQRIGQNFGKAIHTYDLEAQAQRSIAKRLHSLLMELQLPTGGSLLEVGCGTGILTELLLHDLNPATATLNDLSPAMTDAVSPWLNDNIRFTAGDAETTAFPEKYDIIASSSAIQWFSDPGLFFTRLPQYLRQEGIVAISTFGPDNLKEIRSLTGNGLDYLTLTQYKEIVCHHFTPVSITEERITVCFKSVQDVLKHLKKTGVNGLEPSLKRSKSIYDLISAYKADYSCDEGVYLTYHPIYIIARAKK